MCLGSPHRDSLHFVTSNFFFCLLESFALVSSFFSVYCFKNVLCLKIKALNRPDLLKPNELGLFKALIFKMLSSMRTEKQIYPFKR